MVDSGVRSRLRLKAKVEVEVLDDLEYQPYSQFLMQGLYSCPSLIYYLAAGLTRPILRIRLIALHRIP